MPKLTKRRVFWARGCRSNTTGFTLIEMLVVLSVTVLVSSFAFVYTKTGQSQVSLQIEAQKIASFIFRAKSLAITTYNRPVQSCGYGLEINYSARTYTLFSYEPVTFVCSNIQAINSNYPPRVLIARDSLPNNLVFDQTPADRLMLVLFVPPAPKTLLSNNNGSSVSGNALTIYLSTRDGLAERTITVNSAGQIDL